MAIPTCIKCGGVLFEVQTVEPLGSKYKLNFVQCASCGGVVGVIDYFNIGGMLQTLAQKLNVGPIG